MAAKAALHGFEHEVADLGPADPGVDHGAPGYDFAVVGVDDEGTADDIAPTGELEPIRTVSQRGATGSSPLANAGSSA